MRPYDSPDEAAFRAEAVKWLEANASYYERPPVLISSIVSEWSPEEESKQLAVAKDWQRRKFEAGWAGVHWPTKYGGRGGTLMEALIFGQEEAKLDVPWDALVVGLGWCGLAVMAHASPELSDAVLKPLLRGDQVWCQLFSEPGAGSDLAGLATRAERDGDEWVITGQKVWTTLAHQADFGLLVARHDSDLPKHRGMTAFLVDMSAEGIETRPMHQMTDSANFNEVFLDGVRVPDSHRVGEVGAGWSVVITTFTHERFSPSFANTAILDALRRWVELSGRKDEPLVRERYADIYMRAVGLKYLSMRLLTDISQGRLPGPEGSTMKLAGSLLLADIYEFGLELQGPYGALLGRDAREGGEWQTGFLGIPGLLIGGGTSDIQRNIIAERVLGLPGDIRVDKDVAFGDVPRAG
ncbi:MAG: acyl-CoA dehydrogenase family protein [Acidimicrobiia bacterium]|nr:acyl-CoA dehydrogenase family protein [Acidimicrobiia bacterium]MDH3469808.1 acyl-CoA dehydrogenase family protein [Acidimicrobiia bacterium]